MASFIGSIGEYNMAEPFTSYLERLEQFLYANGIGITTTTDSPAVRQAAEKRKVAVLISTVGSKTYGTLRDLCSPASPKDKSFDEICQFLTNHFKPKNLEVAGTYKFHSCFQSETETVNEFSARLRHLASDCNFGTFLERALRDQLISGIQNETTKKKLLGQESLTFDQALKIAVADEAAFKGTLLFKKQSEPVNTVKGSDRDLNRNSRFTGPRPPWKGQSSSNYKCYSCGELNHQRKDCQHRDKVCNNCKTKGHIAKACLRKSGVHSFQVEDEDTQSFQRGDLLTVVELNSISRDITVSLLIEGRNTSMQLDTGCASSLAPESFYQKFCSHIPLDSTSIMLSTYTGERIHPLGQVHVNVEYCGTGYVLPLIIVPTGSNVLFGRNWLREIKLDWSKLLGVPKFQTVNSIPNSEADLTSVLEQHKSLFDSELGYYNGPPEDLPVRKEPPFFKARPVPYAMKPKVEKALLKMEKDGVIKRVNSAPCAAPIVTVLKKNSEEVRVCGDFSVTYNNCAEVETYPIPKIVDLHEALQGCTVFSILDMSQAYHQIPVTEESQPYLTVNTHMGLFSFTRLPNGVHSGPAVFQRVIDNTLAGIPKVACYIDDILVAGVDKADHLKTLTQVLERLSDSGFKLNESKCQFEKSSVTYLGHVIDGEGLHPTEEKLKAVRDAPPPKDVTALKSFLGLIMFYSRFLQNHSTILAPLNNLLRKDVKWQWTTTEEEAFVSAKKLLLESQTLVHYDESLPLYLSCDASSYGAGAVLSHYIDGQYRPIAFASCTLTQPQRNYSQLDKEAFSIIFGLQRFHQYLYGRTFTILTDHRPLLALFAPDRPVPAHAAARLQRWSLILQSYNYNIDYRNTTAHADADSMSRLPLPEIWDPQGENVDCFFLEHDGMSNVTSQMIRRATAVDPVLSKVMQYTMSGWPHVVDPDLVTFKTKQTELTIEQGCLLWGARVIIPSILQEDVLQEVHDTHPGITRMKGLARSYVWWPQIDADIEKLVKSCYVCLATRANPPEAPSHPWLYPQRPWSRVHADFKGPVAGHMYLVIVDAYSKYPEVVKMGSSLNSTSTKATTAALRDIFSRHGIPETLVTDNGPQFASKDFEHFCKQNGMRHRTSAPYKPSSNGQAERVVQILKSALEQARITGENPDDLIPRYLLTYRNTPHSTTRESPAMLLMKRRLRTRLDLLHPSLQHHVEHKQRLVMDRSAHHTLRQFQVGDTVMARNYTGREKWMKGTVLDIEGTRNYIVRVNGMQWRRHVDQLIKCEERDIFKPDVQPAVQATKETVSLQFPDYNGSTQENTDFSDRQIIVEKDVIVDIPVGSKTLDIPAEKCINSQPAAVPERRYPDRVRNPPAILKDYEL